MGVGVPEEKLSAYADLVVRTGANVQVGQALRIRSELEHREFVRLLVEVAYKAGAKYVHVDWVDSPSARARFLYGQPDFLEFFPEYEVARHREMVESSWAYIALVGSEFPDLFADVDPAAMRKAAIVRSQKLKFFSEAMMASQSQWCVAAAPTRAWAKKVFPALQDHEAFIALWNVVLQTSRTDLPDPAAAWQEHDRVLKGAVTYMARQKVRGVRFLDQAMGPDGKPNSDLTVWLTEQPNWAGAASTTPQGVQFFPNMPTEEIFSTPHSLRTEGYVRTSKPGFPFQKEVQNGYFRFESGEVVDFNAEVGQVTMEQFFEINGTRRLGEVALVDVRSPVNQANVTFFETLFDENAACHIAFGEAYPVGVENGEEMSSDELSALGVNKADAHLDLMIGTPTMDVIGLCADGSEVMLMEHGQFTAAITQ
jgi:aminopeptidase